MDKKIKKKDLAVRVLVFIVLNIICVSSAQASIFPNDAVGGLFPSIDNTTCTSTASTFLPAVDYDRTMLYIGVNNQCKTTASCADVHIGRSDITYPNGLYFDNEKEIAGDRYVWQVIPAGVRVYCEKQGATSDHIAIRYILTNYNLASSTDMTAGGTSTSTMSMVNFDNDIGKIGYIATSSIVNGQTITQAQYVIPFYLFLFVFILILSIAGLLFLAGFYRKK